MPVTIKVNGVANSLVHKGSNGVSVATMPDVCKTPSPGGPVPLPYPNVSQSATLAKGTTTVKADGGMMIAIKGSEFSLSNGDNPGVAGGVKSSTFMKESTWILYSFDVKMEGQGACRLTDKKFQNHENTVDLAGTVQNGVTVEEVPGCEAARKAADEAEQAIPKKAREASYVVAGGSFTPAGGPAKAVFGASGGILSSKQIVPGGKYKRFAKGIPQGQTSNVSCGGSPHAYPASSRPKEGHAEAKIIEDLFARRIYPLKAGSGPSPIGGTLVLSVKKKPVCCSCQALIKCAKEAGLNVVICPQPGPMSNTLDPCP